MSMIRKTLKGDIEAFWLWIEKAGKGKHKRLWDAYQADLKRWNDEHEVVSAWIQKHVDDSAANFNRGHSKQQAKLKRLSQRVHVRLAKVIKAFEKDQRER
jgi:hypothetical protein